MTVIQVQHFHKRLIVSIQSSNLGTSIEEPITELPSLVTSTKKSRKKIYKVVAEYIVSGIQIGFLSITKVLKKHKTMIWNLFEYHWIKIVYVSAFVSCVRDVSNYFFYIKIYIIISYFFTDFYYASTYYNIMLNWCNGRK